MIRRPYYRTLSRQGLLCVAAGRWKGTPFRIYNEEPGELGGVDCIHLLHAVNVACGCLEPVDFAAVPRYPKDWSTHNDGELLEKWLRRLGLLDRCERVEGLAKLLPGDVLIFRPGRSHYHVGQLVTAEWFLHAMDPQGARFHKISHRVVPEWFSYGLRPMEDCAR